MSRGILIVDDEAEARGELVEYLADKGHRVGAAENGKVALRRFQGGAIDLVITDVYMPEIEGLELIARLRAGHPGTRIIAVSGGSPGIAMNYLPVALGPGADRTFTKPLDLKALAATVHELLGPVARPESNPRKT